MYMRRRERLASIPEIAVNSVQAHTHTRTHTYACHVSLFEYVYMYV